MSSGRPPRPLCWCVGLLAALLTACAEFPDPAVPDGGIPDLG